MDDIKALSEWLRSLQIINKTSDETIEWSDGAMSVALVPVTINMNKQAIMSKNIVPDPR